jgi:hypothetical protein
LTGAGGTAERSPSPKPFKLSFLDIGARDIGAVVIEWDGERVGVAIPPARSVGSGDPVGEISRVARPSARRK